MQGILLRSGSHRLCQRDHTPPLSHFSTFHLQEVSGKRMAKVIHRIKKCFSKARRRKKSENRKKRWDAVSRAPTEVHRLSPGTVIGKYWLFQLLCLLFVLGWQSKQLDCHSTGFHPDKIPPTPFCHPHGPCLLLQYCFLHVGGPRHIKADHVGAPVGVTSSRSPAEQLSTAQRD